MEKKIWFDMDGTIANLYGVDGWLAMLRNEDTTPYKVAKPLVNMQALARVLNRLTRQGWQVGIVTWTSKSGTAEYNKRVGEVKKNWVKQHLASVEIAYFDVIDYGTPKQIGRDGILFDDEIQNRVGWGENAYDVNEIIEILKAL